MLNQHILVTHLNLIKLDGEKINGNAIFASIRRDTRNWRSFIQYTEMSDGFRPDLGFITTNNLKKYTNIKNYNI